MSSVQQRAIEWIANGEVGTSSKTIWSVMMGMAQPNSETSWKDYRVPFDPDDFRRCHLLLKFIPEWRGRLSEVARIFPEWKSLVENWDELEQLFDEESVNERAPKLYTRMKELLQ